MTRINSRSVPGTCYFFNDEYLQGGFVVDTYKDIGIFYATFVRSRDKWQKITNATSYYEKSNEVRYLFLILSSSLLT